MHEIVCKKYKGKISLSPGKAPAMLLQREAVAELHPRGQGTLKRGREDGDTIGGLAPGSSCRIYSKPSDCWISEGWAVMYMAKDQSARGQGFIQRIWKESERTFISLQQLRPCSGGGTLAKAMPSYQKLGLLVKLDMSLFDIFSILFVQPDFRKNGRFYISDMIDVL